DTRDEMVQVERLDDAVDVIVPAGRVCRVGKIRQGVKVQQRLAQGIDAGREIVVQRMAADGVLRRIASERDVHERSLMQKLLPWEILRREYLAEVALPLFKRRTHVEERPVIYPLVLVLKTDEEEELVTVLVELRTGNQHRTADVAAGIVVLALSALNLRRNRRVRTVVGVEAPVAHVVIRGAVELLAAILGSRAYRDARGTVLGSVVAGLDLDLLYHIGIGGNNGAVVRANVHNPRPVHGHVIVFTAQSVNVVAAVG